MEHELFNIFDRDRNVIGTAPRSEVHKKGYWHETFHCWFVSKEQDIPYLIFQLRSNAKKDYPGLLDITAAGHLLAHETVLDGVREVKEEIGIDVSYDDLIPLGVIEYRVTKGDFIDNELAHVFLYEWNKGLDGFTLQKEEVSGIVRARLTDFEELICGNRTGVRVEGFEIDENGQQRRIDRIVGKDHFVERGNSYYADILKALSNT